MSDFLTGQITIERRAKQDVLVIGNMVRVLTHEELLRILGQGHERLAGYVMTLRETIEDEVWAKIDRRKVL